MAGPRLRIGLEFLIVDEKGGSEFIGYTHLSSESNITGVLVDGINAKSAKPGDEIEITLDRTPFYAEGGGQLADGGLIRNSDGSIIEVDDVEYYLDLDNNIRDKDTLEIVGTISEEGDAIFK